MTNIFPALGEGYSLWTAYRLAGNTEVYKYRRHGDRFHNNRPCGGTGIGGAGIPCDRGDPINGVHMFNETTTTSNGVFPFSQATTAAADGPGGDDLAGVLFSAIWYDLAHEWGMPEEKVDQLIWRVLPLITETGTFASGNIETRLTMRQLAPKFLQAAALLFPRAGGGSIYDDHILHAFLSRGVPINVGAGQPFSVNFRAPIGTFPQSLELSSANAFGSSLPESHQLATAVAPNNIQFFSNGYKPGAVSGSYIAYKFHEYSEYGPCDRLTLTDATINHSTGAIGSNGTYQTVLRNQEMKDIVFFAPPTDIRWLRERVRCNNHTDEGGQGYYASDVAPFGFRVVEAMPNGFSFTTVDHGLQANGKTRIEFTIFDPSLASASDPSEYRWTVREAVSQVTTEKVGESVLFDVDPRDHFRLTLTRTRGSAVQPLQFLGNAKFFTSEGGRHFVKGAPALLGALAREGSAVGNAPRQVMPKHGKKEVFSQRSLAVAVDSDRPGKLAEASKELPPGRTLNGFGRDLPGRFD